MDKRIAWKSQFWQLQVLWWKFDKFLKSFFKPQISFLQNFHISSVWWKITPMHFCSSNNIYLGHKEPIKTNSLDFWVLESKFVKFLMSILKRQVNSSSIFVSFFIVMTHISSVNFKVIHFLLWAKGSYQISNFDTFECSGKNLQTSSCYFPSNKSVFLQILHHSSLSWKINPLYFFSSNNIYFAQNDPIKVKIFETFEYSGQNLSNSLCEFWNDKSIPLQILYPSSASWKIIPLYFFSSNNIYFAQKEPIKVKIFETFECSGQNLSNSSCQFWNYKSIPSQILYLSSVSWKITPL